MALMSSCSKKNEPSQAGSSPSAESTPPTNSPAQNSFKFMEESLPGNSLLIGSVAQNSFKIMAQNLLGRANFTVVEEQIFDYMFTPGEQGQTSTLSRQEGRTKTTALSRYQGTGGINQRLGRMVISLETTPNNYEPPRAFVFQYQINLLGITLKSTDQVALFKATQSTPFASDFMKVNYASQPPTIQRFRISQLSPFPVSGRKPKNQPGFWGTQWLSVTSQRITTSFQKPK